MSFKLYSSYTDPLNSTYEGAAQQATFTFSAGPEQLDFVNSFLVDQYIDECKASVMTQNPGDQVLMLKVYRDTSPTWQTDYKLVITATDITGNDLLWTAIILTALALIITWLVVRPALQAVDDLIYGSDSSGTSLVGVLDKLAGALPWIGIGLAVYLLLPVFTSAKSKK